MVSSRQIIIWSTIVPTHQTKKMRTNKKKGTERERQTDRQTEGDRERERRNKA